MTIGSPKGPERDAATFASLYRTEQARANELEEQLDRTEDAYSELLRGMAARASDFRRALAFADAHVPQWERIIGDHKAEVERLTAEVVLFRERDGLTRKALQHDGDGPLQFAALVVRQERDRLRAEVSRLREQLAPAKLRADVHQERADQLVIGLRRLLDKDREIENGPAPVSESVPVTPQRVSCRETWYDPADECTQSIDGIHGCGFASTAERPRHDHNCSCGSWKSWEDDPLRASAPSEASPQVPETFKDYDLSNAGPGNGFFVEKDSSPPPSGGDSDTTPRVWVEGDVALDQTNFVHRRFESGWRTYPREQGVQYGDDLMEAGLGPMLRLAGVPSETDNLGHLSLFAAERVRASVSPSSLPQEGGTDD